MNSFRDLQRSPIRFEDALRELVRVHELEQARLLRIASCFATRNRRSDSALQIPVPRSPRERIGRRDTAAWRDRTMEEIRTSRADGDEVLPLLAQLVRTPSEKWPSAVTIATAALEVGRSHAGLLALARAQLGEERFEEACEMLLEVLLEQPLEDLRFEALEAAAVGFDLAGDLPGALAFYEAALVTQGGDLRQAVPLLAIALCEGDDARASVASDRLHGLDLGIAGIRSQFRAALAGVRKRFVRPRDPLVCSSSARRLEVRGFLARHRGPAATVAELVLHG